MNTELMKKLLATVYCSDRLVYSSADGETTVTLMCGLKPNHEGPHSCGNTTWTHTFEPGTRSGT